MPRDTSTDWILDEYRRKQHMLQEIRSSAEKLRAAWIHYSDHPADFIDDWAMTLDPRVKPSLMPFKLFPKQREFINWLHDKYTRRSDGLVEKSRDAGASWLCCAYAWWLWLFHPDQVIAFGSRKEDLVDNSGDPDCLFEKIRFLIDKTPKEFKPDGFNYREHSKHLRISNPINNSVIKGEAGTNIGRGGRSSLHFNDEAAFLEQPEKIEAALSQNTDVKIDVSTPNGAGNPFYRKRFGGNVPVFTFHWRDDPRKDDRWYRAQRDKLDPVIVAQEIDIDYNASVENNFMPPELVDEAMRIRPSQLGQQTSQPAILGVDVARYGSDRSAITMRQGRVVYWIETYNQVDTMELAGIVSRILDTSAEPIGVVFVDVIGIGAGVVDRLRERYGERRIVGVNAAEKSGRADCINKRAEMWMELRDWLKNGPVSIPAADELRTDLCALQYKYNSNGQMQLESKDDAKKRGVRSPDLGDSLALCFSYPVTWAMLEENRPNSYHHTLSGRSSVTGY